MAQSSGWTPLYPLLQTLILNDDVTYRAVRLQKNQNTVYVGLRYDNFEIALRTNRDERGVEYVSLDSWTRQMDRFRQECKSHTRPITRKSEGLRILDKNTVFCEEYERSVDDAYERAFLNLSARMYIDEAEDLLE